jgi:ABC-2 type transport system permease protein
MLNRVVAGITLRQLLSRRRTLLLLLLGGVLVLVALIVRLAGDESQAQRVTARLLADMGVATLMPLVALLFGTGAIGSELDDGTAVYLLAKPVRRSTILLTKLAIACLCSVVLTCVPILLAGLVGARGLGDGLVLGFVAATAIGSILYCAVFMALSLVTGRALVFGLGYVLIWEGLLAGLFAGTRTFSVRQITLAFADLFAGVPPETFDARLDLTTAAIMAVIVLVSATALAIRRLSALEIAGETA